MLQKPLPTDIPPALARRLEPGESVVWLSTRRERHLKAEMIVYAFLLLTSTFILFALGGELANNSSSGTLNILVFGSVPLLAIAGAVRAWFASGSEIFALTDRRFLIVDPVFPEAVNRYAREARYRFVGGTVWPVTRLYLSGTRARGSVSLHHISRNGPRRRFGPVDHPREVAELIKRTLKLNIAIDDHLK